MWVAKLTALVLILSVVACCSASGYTRRASGERCEEEMEELMPMEHCEMWVERAGGRGRGYMAEEGADEHKDACCAELGQFSSSECRCQAARSMMPGADIWMRRMACSLPSMCGMQSCGCPR